MPLQVPSLSNSLKTSTCCLCVDLFREHRNLVREKFQMNGIEILLFVFFAPFDISEPTLPRLQIAGGLAVEIVG